MSKQQVQSKFYDCPHCHHKEPYQGYPKKSKVKCLNCGKEFAGYFNVFTKFGR